jgi:hypothetical protein
MRSIRRPFRRPSLVPKTQRNRTVLFRTHFTTIWRSKIHIGLKVDAEAGVAFVYGVQCIISIKDSEGSILVSAHASTVYAVGRIKSKTKQDLPTLHPP